MHVLYSLFIGLITGVIVTIPLGPIMVYVAQRALNGEIRKGILVGIGSVTIDVIYCLLITLGLMSLLTPYLENVIVQLVLSLFVIGYGVKMLVFDRKKTTKDGEDGATEENNGQPFAKSRKLLERKRYNLLLGATMAIANPSIIVSYTAIISFITANGLLADHIIDKVVFSLANGVGSMACFVGLSFFVRSRRNSLPKNFMRHAGTVAAILIILFGAYFTFVVVQRLIDFM